MKNCKYCDVEIENKNGKRKIPACVKCRHKFYKELDPKGFNERQNERARKRYIPEKQALYFQKWKEENPELYKARHLRSNRSVPGRFNKAKARAARNGRIWDINKYQFEGLLQNKCYYCNGHLNDTGSGLDRMNSDLDYTFDNVVPSCGICNKIKTNLLTCDEMKVAMMAVINLRGKKDNG